LNFKVSISIQTTEVNKCEKPFFHNSIFRNPKTIGAILPSSSFLGDKMIGKIDFKVAKYIVVSGPDTGIHRKIA